MNTLPEIVKLQLENLELKATVLKSEYAKLEAQRVQVLKDLASTSNIPFEKLAIQGDTFFNIEEQKNASEQPVQKQGRTGKLPIRSGK